MRLFVMLFLLSTMMLLSGCSSKIGEFTVMSTYNFELQAESQLVTREAKGSSAQNCILMFLKIGKPNLQKAVEKALLKNEADFLTNVRVYEKNWSLILFGQHKYVVEGFAFRTKHAEIETGFFDQREIIHSDGLVFVPGEKPGYFDFIGLDNLYN